MNKPRTWLDKLNNICLHEKVVILLLALVLVVISFDSWFKNLPISGYGLVFIILILIGCTTWVTCHGIKWLLHCNKPLKFYINEKSENEKLRRLAQFVTNAENAFIDKLLKTKGNAFDPLFHETTLSEQLRLFLKDTERDFVKSWYMEITQNPSFLSDTHILLEEIFFKVVEKFKLVNYKNLILNVLVLYLNHLQEYKKSVKRKAKSIISETVNEGVGNKSDNKEKDGKPQRLDLNDTYRYCHPASQSDKIVNYYLMKVMKWILQEYAPQEFTASVQCKILTGILAKKILKATLTTLEDPVWIYIKLIYLLDPSKYGEMLENKVYVVKEKVLEEEEDSNECKKPMVITKRYMKSNLFKEESNLFERREFSHEYNKMKTMKDVEKKAKVLEKESLNLSLKSDAVNEGSHISSVLGGIISSTAGPLLPENVSFCFEPLNKMWQSPVTEQERHVSDIRYGKQVVDGISIECQSASMCKRLSRSRSTESVAPAELSESLKAKDISIGEELCENVRFTSQEDVTYADASEARPKWKHSGAVKRLVKTRSFDSGSVAIENSSFEDERLEGSGDVSKRDESPKSEYRDVSPVYEEPQDFATTIAKLRSLLQQRESSSTLSDKSIQSIDLPSSGLSQIEASDSGNRTQSTDLENSSFESQIAPDIPTDGRPFVNVSIPKTELATDSNGTNYIIYSVQYDGIYRLKDQNNSDESEFVLQTCIVKKRFQDFVTLQNKLEENSQVKNIMKGVKGPSKWLNFPFSGKNDESIAASRKQALEVFVQQLCSNVEICATTELQEFLGYGCNESRGFVKKDSESSLRRIDKLLTNKVTDVFNTIKTALPSFDFETSNSVVTSGGDNGKNGNDQKLLPGFLTFSNRTEEYELNFDFVYREPTGNALTDDIRRYFNAKTDGIEDAMDVLDSNDWLAERRECILITTEGKCVWHGYKDTLDDDMDQLDSWLPVYSVLLDILCELLEETESWVTKEPVIRLVKVLTGHWELAIQERLSKLDWDQIAGNLLRLLRTIIFEPSSSADSLATIELDGDNARAVLKTAILNAVPNGFARFIKREELSSAVNLLVDSLQYFRMNRDVLLRLFDILLVQFLRCRHLTNDDN